MLAALLGVLAVISPVVALVLAIGMLFVAITVWNLVAGLCLFTVVSFFEQLPGFKDATFGPPKILGAVLVLSWLLVLANRQGQAPNLLRDRAMIGYAALVLLTWTLISRLWASDAGVATGSAVRLALGVVLVFVVFTAVREPKHLQWVIWAYITGALLSALVGIGATSPEASIASPDEGRLAGGIADPNELAAMLVPALVFASAGLVAARGQLTRLALGVAIAIFAVALFLTESRGGIVALVVVLAAAVTLAGRFRPRVIVIAVIVGAIGVGYYTLAAPPQSIQRLTGFFAGGGTGRTDLWTIATHVIGDHPVVGVGSGNFQVVEPTYAAGTIDLSHPELVVDNPKVVHNTYLEIWAELGVVGLAAFAVVLLGSLAQAKRGVARFVRSGDPRNEALARGFVVGVAGMLAAFTFISGQYEKQFWLLVGLAAAFNSVGRGAAAAPDDESEPQPRPKWSTQMVAGQPRKRPRERPAPT